MPDSRQASFSVKLGGYDMQEVDEFLDDLRKQNRGSAPSGAAPLDVADLPAPAFATVRVGGAYTVADVDAFIASVFTAVRDGRPAPRIGEASFGRTYFGGYSEQEVDDYLDTLADLLGQ